MPESSIRSTPRPGGDHRFRPGDEPGEKVLVVDDPDGERELGRVSGDGTSILTADGRLFRVTVHGSGGGRIEAARWDLPGPYVVAREGRSGWSLERTPAGRALAGCDALELLLEAAIETLEGG